MSALELVRLLRRRWWIIAVMAVVAGGVALLYSLSLAPTYRATAQVFVLPNRADWALNMYTDARVRDLAAVLLSRPMAEKAVARMSGPTTAEELLGRVQVQVQTDQNSVLIQAEGASPQSAADTANVLADLLLEWVAGFNANQDSADHIEASVLSPAVPPGAPSAPRYKVNTAAGILLGALLGLPLALVWDMHDDMVGDPEEAEARLGLPVWPMQAPLPLDQIVPLEDPHGEVAAALHKLHTRVQVAALERGGRDPAAMPAWSSLALVGVSRADLPPVLAADLGVAIAQEECRVLLVDADLPEPALHSLLGVTGEPGLAEATRPGGTGKAAPVETRQPGLLFLPAGANLSAGEQEAALRRAAGALPELSQAADLVLLHLPPVAEVQAATFLAARAEAVVLFARSGHTPTRAVLRLVKSLQSVQANVLGLVLWKERRGR